MIFLKKDKTNWKYLLIVIIVAVFVSGRILWCEKQLEISFTQLPKIKKPEKVAEDEIADWETYRNEEYGFEIKYPEEEMLYKKISEINFYKDPAYKGINIGELKFGCSPYIYIQT